MKYYLASHGSFASGIQSSLNVLLGQGNVLQVYDAYLDETSLQDSLEQFFEDIPKQERVILLSDLYGGSVNQVLYTYLERPNTILIAGVNLALVLEIVAQGDALNETDLDALIEQSREALRRVDYEADPAVETEDFF